MANQTQGIKLPDTLTMSTTEASQVMGKPLRTIQSWCESGNLPATKIGKTWIINTSKFAELLGL